MTSRLMLDSGAFAVWNRGRAVDLDQYIQFCLDNEASSYVCLDVIPGRPNQTASLTAAALAEACEGSWRNYQEMKAAGIPQDKLIPVFHQNDDFRWIKRYLDDGVTYLGVSPANDRTTKQKLRWLTDVRRHLCGRDGNPVIRTHGFAVTSFPLMNFWRWYSVDSASWIRQAALGGVYIPDASGRYDKPAESINFSPRSPQQAERGKHYTTLSPSVLRRVHRYLDDIGVPLGELAFETVPEGYKLLKGELFLDEGKRRIARRVTDGVTTNYQYRFLANAIFIKRANEALPVDHIFFAGLGPKPRVEKMLDRRLLSYHDITTSKQTRELFQHHQQRLRKYQNANE